MTLVQDSGFQLGNVDLTIVAQSPKMAPHIEQMRKNIASDLHAHLDQVNVKATTTEKLGFAGRKEGIACYAVVLLSKSK
jgi:2-C-methyl-D-erythritol 2,4-cyclodiphosphate synthase